MEQKIKLGQAEPQEVSVGQGGSEQSVGVGQTENVQAMSVAQVSNKQPLSVAQRDDAVGLRMSTDVRFMKGDPGDKGDPGVSPTVRVEEGVEGHTVIIADANGVQSFFVADGEDVDEIPVSFIEAL